MSEPPRRRAAPGVAVSAGRLRVDAARAVDKLRDYQLADPHLWILEAVRAARAMGAESLELETSPGRLRLLWRGGAPPDPEVLTELFDELVDPAPRPARRPIRLLATAVNTALGLDPLWLDVWICRAGARAAKVRFSPALLETTSGEEAAGLRSLAVETEARASTELPSVGGLVELRRLPGSLATLLGVGEPAEARLVRAACDDLPVPLRMGGGELRRGLSHDDLFRIELEGADAFLALVDPSVATGPMHLDVAELGVRIGRQPLVIEGLDRGPVPLRLFVDAPRMRTNASRSAVALDSPELTPVVAASRALVTRAVERLARELEGAGESEWSDRQRERLRAAALCLIASAIAGEEWRERAAERSPLIAPLLDLPLLVDATGRPRSVASFPAGEGERSLHVGKAPLDAELRPWLGHVLWASVGDAARRLLGDTQLEDASVLARRARRYAKQRERFLSAPTRTPSLKETSSHLLRVPLQAPGVSMKSVVPADRFDLPELQGEVVLCDPRRVTQGSVSLRIAGREIELLELDGALPLAAVVECAALRPTASYENARRDQGFEDALAAVEAASVVAAEALAARLSPTHAKRKGRQAKQKPGDRSELLADWVSDAKGGAREQLLQLARRGIEAALDCLEWELEPEEAAEVLLQSRSPLVHAKLFAALEGEPLSLADLARLAASAPSPFAIGVLDPGRELAAPPKGRPVLRITSEEAQVLEDLFPEVHWVDYAAAPETRGPRRRPLESVACVIEEQSRTIEVRWGERAGRVGLWHAGRLVEARPLEGTLSPLVVLVEDHRFIPSDAWRGVVRESLSPLDIAGWERELARRYVDALTGRGGRERRAAVIGDLERAGPARRSLLQAIASATQAPGDWLGVERALAMRKLPLVRLLDVSGLQSLEWVAERFPEGPLPCLPPHYRPDLEDPGWTPLRVSELEREAFARLLCRETSNAAEEAASRARVAKRARRLERLLERPVEDPSERWAERIQVDERTFATFAHRAPKASVQVRVEGRTFTQMDVGTLPLRLCTDLSESHLDEDLTGLTGRARRHLESLARKAARALIENELRSYPSRLFARPEARSLLGAWLEDETPGAPHVALRVRVRREAKMPSVQGVPTTVEEASTAKGIARVARWDGPWLDPLEEEARAPADAPAIQLPPEEEEARTLRALIVAVAKAGTRDVTSAVARLQARRRFARGLTAAPRLTAVPDARFRWALGALFGGEVTEALETLGVGEAALVKTSPARVLLFEEGEHTRSVDANLIPRVHVAAHSPLTVAGQPLTRADREAFIAALRDVTAKLTRKLIDETPAAELPEWTRRVLRESVIIGGEVHFERLGEVPLFETTTGEWKSPRSVRAAEEEEGVWWTARPFDWAPLDPARFALRLTREEAEKLGAFLNLFDASRELELDRAARKNLAQPPVESLELFEWERAATSAICSLAASGDERSVGTVALLAPGHERFRGVRVSRDRQPLGTLSDGGTWPCIARVDDPDLTPNRTAALPEDDLVLERLLSRIQMAARAMLAAKFPIPEAAPASLAIPSLEATLALGEVEGVAGALWLSPDVRPGEIRVTDARRQEERRAQALPICGELWLVGAWPPPRLLALVRDAYRGLLAQLTPSSASRTPHLVHAWAAGVRPHGDVRLACFVETHTLSSLEARLGDPRPLTSVTDAERESALALLPPGDLFVDDGGPVAASVRAWLGPRLQSFADAILDPLDGRPSSPPLAVGEHTSGARGSPPPKKPARPTLATEVARAVVSLSLPAPDVRIDGRRKRPALSLREGRAKLAGKSAAIARAAELVEVESVAAGRAVDLVAARLLGAMRRDAGEISAAAELQLLAAMLRSKPTEPEDATDA